MKITTQSQMMASACHAAGQAATAKRAGGASVGAYVFLREARAAGIRALHRPHDDSDKRLVPIGASYGVPLVQQRLPLA